MDKKDESEKHLLLKTVRKGETLKKHRKRKKKKRNKDVKEKLKENCWALSEQFLYIYARLYTADSYLVRIDLPGRLFTIGNRKKSFTGRSCFI